MVAQAGFDPGCSAWKVLSLTSRPSGVMAMCIHKDNFTYTTSACRWRNFLREFFCTVKILFFFSNVENLNMFSLIQLAISPQSSTYLVQTLMSQLSYFQVISWDMLKPVGPLINRAVTFCHRGGQHCCDSCIATSDGQTSQEVRGIHQVWWIGKYLSENGVSVAARHFPSRER